MWDESTLGRREAKTQQEAEDRQLDKDCSPCKDFDSETRNIASLPTETRHALVYFVKARSSCWAESRAVCSLLKPLATHGC